MADIDSTYNLNNKEFANKTRNTKSKKTKSVALNINKKQGNIVEPHTFTRTEIKPIWCPGCPIYSIYSVIANEMKAKGWNAENTVVVSGIGCTGMISGYFNCEGVQTTHGRTLPVAEAIKLVRPELNVIVISGDGDLSGIGGNHLLHTIRRNPNLHIFMNRNRVYAMTGGQLAPTTPKESITQTTPNGNTFLPLNSEALSKINRECLFIKSSTIYLEQFKTDVKNALNYDKLSFVEINTWCITEYGPRQGAKNLAEMNEMLKRELEKER